MVKVGGQPTLNGTSTTDTKKFTVMATNDIEIGSNAALYGTMISNNTIEMKSSNSGSNEFYGFVGAHNDLKLATKYDLHMDIDIADDFLMALVDDPPPIVLVR